MNFKFIRIASLCLGFTAWSTCTAIANESIPLPAAHNEIATKKLKGKTIVITGASSGLGRGTALKLAAQGANLVIASRRIEVLDELARQCGPNTIAVKTDVSSAGDVVNLAKTAITKFGRIDVWINDAGVGAIGRFVDIPMEDHARIVQTDLIGVIYGSHCALKQFELQRAGTLINVSSIVGEVPLAYYSSYSASKVGVAGLDRAIRAELKAGHFKNIHICTVYPMPTDTPFWANAANYSKHTTQPPWLQKPEPVVDAIVKLVSKPKNEVVITALGKVAVALHRRHPDLVENKAAKIIYKTQINSAAPIAEPTDGSLVMPSQSAPGISGGVADRLKAERGR